MDRKTRLPGKLLLTVFIILLASCTDKYRELEQEEKAKIEEYLTRNSSLNFELKTSGLYYLEVEVGTGKAAATNDTARVFYTVYFLDGTKLDTNVGTVDTLIFLVNRGFLISGFDEGITYMKEGGKAKFLIPSRLAYGSTGDYYGNISGYTPLLFDVDLIKIKPGPAEN
jgi:FKBP-type peptidyl-prolyl cis-trans isomerase